MANTTIPNLPAAVSLDGNEQLEVVQNGTSKRVTADQIAALAENTQGTVTEINTGGALVGGPITTTGTISLPPDAVTNTYLAEMATNTVKANLTGLTANPTDVTPSAILDTFGSAEGSMLYRGVSSWQDLAPGTGGFYLTTTGNLPQWTALAVGPGDLTPTGVTPGTYGTASQVAQLTVNAGGQLTAASNVTITIPSGQVTGLGTMATQNANNVAITGGNINGTIIGATTPAQAYFTTIPQGVWNGTAIGVAYGGTGATDAATARTNLGLGSMAVQNASSVAITGGSIDGVSIGGLNPQAGSFASLTVSGNSALGTVTSGTWNGSAVGVAYGGTGATSAPTARTNLGAAASGANSDITSLSGLTTPLSAPQGGTGFGSYTEGDLLYAVTSSSLGRLNDVAVGNVLLSGGVGVAPAYGKVDLTTHVTGTLPVTNGGTGATTLTGYVKGNGTSAFTAAATIPNSDLQNSSVTIGSTTVALGASTATLAGLTSVTLTQDPTLALQASTKQYVDDQVATVSNLTYHTQVTATTTGNLTANYNNGAGGIGATLTNTGALAQFQIDSYTPAPLARVLIKDQTNAYENGIYEVTTQGDAISVPWVLTRTADFDSTGSGPNNIQTGASVFVQSGNTWGSTSWVMVTTGTINVGSTNLVWTQTSSSGNILVNSPLSKAGNTISLGTVTVPFGGTGQTSYTIGDLLYADSSTSLAKLADVATGNVLRSGGIGVAPAWGKVDLTTDVTGTLPVANGGSGTSTAFTAGSVLFAGASGVYSQNNANFFWDSVNTRLGIHTNTPDATFTVMSETQTAVPPGALPAGTDIHVIGANGAETRITQDAFGTGNYPAYTGRHSRGTAASPTASQTDDVLSQYTGRGYGATGYNSASTGVFQFQAAENFTDSAQGTYASLRLTATGAAAPTEVMRFGPIGQLGVGGSSYGTANQLLTSGGSSAAPSWQSGINVTTLAASSTVTMSATTDNISIGTSQTSGLLSLGGASQTGATAIAPSTKSITIGLGGGATESGETKTLNIGTAGVSGSTTAINIGASAGGATSTTTLYGNVKINNLTVSKPVFTDGSGNFTSSGTLLTDQGGTGLTSYTGGDLLYYSTGTALSKLGIGTNGQILTSTGSAPQWSDPSAVSVSTATNLAGGAAGSVPYQSGASTTTFLGIGAADTVLTSSGSAPQWSTSLSLAGNLNFSSTAQRITGDMSNATESNRLAFQSSTTNGGTRVNILTNGTGTASSLDVFGVSDPTNAAVMRVRQSGTESQLLASITGTGTYLPMTFYTGGSERVRIDTSGGVGIATSTVSTNFRQEIVGAAGSNTGPASSGTTQSASAVMRIRPGGGFTATLDIGQGGGTGSWLQSTDTSDLATTYPLLLNPVGGNVGIGTASPATTLHLKGAFGNGCIRAETTGSLTNNNIYNFFAYYDTGGQAAYVGYGGVANSFDIVNAQASGFLTFKTGGYTERMRIDSSGQVGVGFTPYAGQGSLQVYRTVVGAGPATSGSTDTSQVFTATASTVQIGYGAYADGTGWLQQRSGTNYATNYALALQPNGGNVAIGTGNAAYGQLVIQKASSTTDGPVLTLWNSNSNAGNTCGYLRFFSNATARAEISSVIDSGAPFAGNFIFKTGENTLTERMRISSDGTVGIGTSSFIYGAKLYVSSAGSAQSSIFVANPGIGSGQVGVAAASSNFKIYNTYSTGTLAGGVGIDIDQNGNVGIGTTTPSSKLQVNGTITTTGLTVSNTISGSINGNAATVTDGMYLASTQTSGGRKAFSASQNVGTMLTATGSLGGLEAVNPGGANAAFMSFHRAGAYASYFGIDTDNNFAVGGWSAGAALASMKVGSFGVGTAASGTAGEIRATNNITAYYSDARLKDFKGKIGDALNKVSQLNGYYYTENEKAEEFGYNNKELQVGVSAQEVQAVLPEVIAPAPFDRDGENKSKSGEDYMTVRYEKLVPLLIEAIKELTAKVEALEGKK